MTQENRRPLIVANWKMNKNQNEAEEFIKAFKPQVASASDRDAVLCPPFTALLASRQLIEGSNVQLGGQNMSENKSGAFTGEIAADMLASVGCRFVILGHSERREYQKESDVLVNKKIVAALAENLTPIVCVGEKLEQREAGKTMDVVSTQVKGALDALPSAEVQKLVIAYEPVWAIGTGKTATSAQAQEVHAAIRDIIKDLYGSATSLGVRILYGGSVKPDNMSELMACEDIDGGLVGGASLKADSFAQIVNFSILSKAE